MCIADMRRRCAARSSVTAATVLCGFGSAQMAWSARMRVGPAGRPSTVAMISRATKRGSTAVGPPGSVTVRLLRFGLDRLPAVPVRLGPFAVRQPVVELADGLGGFVYEADGRLPVAGGHWSSSAGQQRGHQTAWWRSRAVVAVVVVSPVRVLRPQRVFAWVARRWAVVPRRAVAIHTCSCSVGPVMRHRPGVRCGMGRRWSQVGRGGAGTGVRLGGVRTRRVPTVRGLGARRRTGRRVVGRGCGGVWGMGVGVLRSRARHRELIPYLYPL